MAAGLGDVTWNPVTNQFEQTQTFDPTNQWAWGPNGLMPLGGSPDVASTMDPFMSLNPAYAGGQPITAATWQDAARQSMNGFMRENLGMDPIINYDPQNSGTSEGSNFQIGTLAELANKIPNFFNTNGLTENYLTGQINYGHQAPTYDPLVGLNPNDKLLAFEDTPLQQVESIMGQVPGMLFNNKLAAPYQQTYRDSITAQQDLNSQIADLYKQMNALPPSTMPTGITQVGVGMQGQSNSANFPGSIVQGANPAAAGLSSQIAALQAQIVQQQQYAQNAQNLINQNAWVSLADAQKDPAYKDWNDFLFKLDINQYTPPPQNIVASPQSVLNKFFDTPAYQLAFGSDPQQLDASLSPVDRFKADPGYQFAQTEGLNQINKLASSKGLLQSGATQRDLQGYSQGLADQNYQRYIQQNEQLFTNWQQGLAGMANQGAQLNGASQAAATGQNLANSATSGSSQVAQLLAQLGLTGANAYTGLGGTGANALGSLGQGGLSAFAGLGTAGLNALTQGGIAQGNNMTQTNIANMQAQNQANQSSQQGFGQLAGQLMGGLF